MSDQDSQIMHTIAMIKEIYNSIRTGLRTNGNMKQLRDTLKKSIDELKGLQKNGNININIDNSKNLNQTFNNQKVLNLQLEKTLEKQQSEFKKIVEPKKIDQLISNTRNKLNEQQKAKTINLNKNKSKDIAKAKPKTRLKSK